MRNIFLRRLSCNRGQPISFVKSCSVCVCKYYAMAIWALQLPLTNDHCNYFIHSVHLTTFLKFEVSECVLVCHLSNSNPKIFSKQKSAAASKSNFTTCLIPIDIFPKRWLVALVFPNCSTPNFAGRKSYPQIITFFFWSSQHYERTYIFLHTNKTNYP
jgi:hypothetical protein